MKTLNENFQSIRQRDEDGKAPKHQRKTARLVVRLTDTPQIESQLSSFQDISTSEGLHECE
jgi:hypothetical protein